MGTESHVQYRPPPPVHDNQTIVPAPESRPRFPIELADRCVMCGLCLPHCPTYRLSRDEGESPRGRIALMMAVARGQLEATPKLLGHLDRCLSCRACERMCPSRVPYGTLIDSARALSRPTRRRRFALDAVLIHPTRLRWLASALRLLQRSRLDRLAPLFGLGRAAQWLPPLSRPRQWQRYYPAQGDQPGEPVALFTGCTGAVLDAAANDAAIALLTRLGHSVHVPPEQGCCGALHQHDGRPDTARQLSLSNQRVFAGLPVATVLGTASACTLQLQEARQPSTVNSDQPVVADASAFLAAAEWPSDPILAPLHETVALHLPCTQVHGLRTTTATHDLLQRIPDLRLMALETQARCCGAAGSYMLEQPDMADALGLETLEQIRTTGATILLSSNIGCRLHLSALARRQGLAIETLHPLTLLARQLRSA